MIEKLSIEDLVIKVMPGGFFLGVIYFYYFKDLQITLNVNFDLMYTFIFFCLAFIVGEILQTIAHLSECIIDVFFKFRRPSKVFLYKNNPVMKSDYKRNELLNFLNLNEEKSEIFNKKYKDLHFLKFWKISKNENDISQSIFWKLYTNVSNSEEVKVSNRGYLFVRVIMIVFLLLSLIFFYEDEVKYTIFCILMFLTFLWRSRGYARGLVFKVVLLNLK